ncbi:hypothetical protein A1O3_07303 [Capronia epimyces CBS 606.96]|uniref:RING-type domain-containing protein n=1 Tax=Capronia epimyces CBS 606.96 TaxID=1182542 RepID=W9XUJ6_9EURO|nr:uncharacterized protein A1O3_07303 [Capronia epimyces CBS 606.96]EXJ81015.1 hypothetical protein A1O3_07303 [Capronia epimyces CBS 606.96]
MSSNAGSLAPQPHFPSFSPPPSIPPTGQQQPVLKTGDLRQRLEDLDTEAKSLRTNQAQLEAQLKGIRNRIAANDSVIQGMMKQLDQQAFIDQRAERQSAFRATVLDDDNVVEALRRKAGDEADFKSALLAIVTNRAKHDDNNVVGAALMTELSGDVLPFLHEVATQVLECDNDIDAATLKAPSVDDGETAMPSAADEPQRLCSMPPAMSMRSPSVKSEPSSVQTLPTTAQSMSTTLTAAAAAAPAPLARGARTQTHSRLVQPIGPGPGSRPRPHAQFRAVPAAGSESEAPDPAHMSRAEKNFPGLLGSLLKGQEMLRPKNTPAANLKRARESVETGATPANDPPTKQVKKQRLEKEPAYTPTFAAFIKQLETVHVEGKPITELIKCSRCQQFKPKCRILVCMHLYCHKCVLTLRAEAEKGNPVTGFRAFCVKPDCNGLVSGKTSVVESEAMAFLKWYDEQPADLTSTAAQLHVLNGALDEFPDDPEIERKLNVVHAQINKFRLTAQPDVRCNLLQLVKLARKPY